LRQQNQGVNSLKLQVVASVPHLKGCCDKSAAQNPPNPTWQIFTKWLRSAQTQRASLDQLAWLGG